MISAPTLTSFVLYRRLLRFMTEEESMPTLVLTEIRHCAED